MRSTLKRIGSTFILSLITLGLFGCGGSGLRFGTVEGVVTLDGQPLPNVDVQFLPESTDGFAPPAVGVTDANGRYTAVHNLISRSNASTSKGEGVLVGWNKVIIEDYKMKVEHLPPPGRVPLKYTDPKNTPFRFEIKEGSQTINFQLTSK